MAFPGKAAMIPAILCVIFALVPQLWAAGAQKPAPKQKPAPFVSLMDSSAWKLTKAYRSIQPWKCTDSLFEASDGWIATDAVWGDFVLEGEFLYNGKSQGGVLVRGNREAWIPWLHGYEMDIDADMPGTGHIHFPFRPQPNPGVVQFPVDIWHAFSIRAAGQDISVKLDGKEVIKFRDDHYRYGSICLEGEKGGLRYRDLRIQKLDKTAPAGLRSPYTELFDSATPPGLKTEGSVSFANGVMEIDGSARPASVRLPQTVAAGAMELDVWCRRPKGSSAPYRIGFCAGTFGNGPCFTCRNNRVQPCGTAQCTSQFPMFMETTCMETWRFEITRRNIDAFRFGEKVMSCSDTIPKGSTLCVSADSCVLLLRGARVLERRLVIPK
jgi:Domain of Unknown Function (DUF1080)